MSINARERYFDQYWREQDKARVSRRAEWRATKLFSAVGNRFSRLLDIGAGQGEILRYFRSGGYRVEGWDLSPHAVQCLRADGFVARVVDIEKDQFQGNFDLVCCCEVLQQTEDPHYVLLKIKNILRPEGRLYLSFPNEFHLLRRLGIGEPALSHITIFSKRRTKELLKISGFTIERRFYQPVVPPRWGKVIVAIGQFFADLFPSLFALSHIYLVRKRDDN